jgi:hypothetical protein
MKMEKKKMKDSNNSDKVPCAPSGAEGKNLFEQHNSKRIVQTAYGGPFVLYSNKPQQVVAVANYYVPTQIQQSPIKEKGARTQTTALNEWYSGYNHELAYAFKNNVPVPA